MYPVIPWIGLMALGYQFGNLYRKGFDAKRRKRLLLLPGTGSIFLFLALRLFNIYGDPSSWHPQNTLAFSIISFFNTTKYPPSLLFLLMTIGPSLIFLALAEEMYNKATTKLVVIGRVPLFFYALHIYMIHLLAAIGIVLAGRPWTDMILIARSLITASLIDYGYNLTEHIAELSTSPIPTWHFGDVREPHGLLHFHQSAVLSRARRMWFQGGWEK